MERRSVDALLVSLLICGTGKPAFAADSTPTPATAEQAHERVVELVTQSAEHYEAGRFQRAVELLEEAFALEQAPTIQYNLARAYEGLGDTRRAMAAYRSYLRLAPDAQDRGAVEQRLKVLARQLEEREALRRRAVDAEATRAKPQVVEAGPGWLPWGVSAVGALVVGAGIFFGVRASTLHDDAQASEFAADAADTNRDAQTYATLANVAFIAGGVLTVGGVAWGLFSLQSADETSPRAASRGSGFVRLPTGGGVSLSGAF